MAISRNRMIGLVSSADVVIVNPTHYAVALKYEAAQGRARSGRQGRGRHREADPRGGRGQRRADRARARAHPDASTGPASSASSSRPTSTRPWPSSWPSCSASGPRAGPTATTSSPNPPSCEQPPRPSGALANHGRTPSTSGGGGGPIRTGLGPSPRTLVPRTARAKVPRRP